MLRKLGRMAMASVAVATVAAVMIEIRASARWAEFTARTNQLRAKLEAERGEREPLVGPARAGNAWDEYGPALAELEVRTRESKTDVFDEVERPGRATRAYATLHAAAPSLARLREAVRCERAFADVIPSLTPLQRAVNLLVLSARERLIAGGVEPALDELAVALQLGSDAGRMPGLIGLVFSQETLVTVARELVTVMADARVTAVHLERIDRTLEAVDRQFPSFAAAIEWDQVFVRRMLRDVVEGVRPLELNWTSESSRSFEVRCLAENGRLAPWKVSLVAWRHGFSRRLLAAETADWCERLVDVARRAEVMDCKQADALCRELSHEPVLCENGALVQSLYARTWREARGRLRLVWAVSRVRRGLGPDVLDPVTLKPVGVRVEPEGIVLWLPWGKGDGTGTWEARRGDDLVIVVR